MRRHLFDFLTLFIASCWLILAVYWAYSAIGVKERIAGKGSSNTWALKRLVLIVALVVLYKTPIFKPLWHFASGISFFHNEEIRICGAIVVAIGTAFAIWARYHLGLNWSGHPSMAVCHELITSGPYCFVRHPIYSGLIVALFGSGLVIGPLAMLLFILSLLMFIRRVRVEDSYMFELFSSQYSVYRAKTKALIPLIW